MADQGHVFTVEDGRPVDPAYLTRLFQTLRKGPEETLPRLRHRYASLTIASGTDICRAVQAAQARLDFDHR